MLFRKFFAAMGLAPVERRLTASSPWHQRGRHDWACPRRAMIGSLKRFQQLPVMASTGTSPVGAKSIKRFQFLANNQHPTGTSPVVMATHRRSSMRRRSSLRNATTRNTSSRRGSVLLAVLVIIALFTLSAYTFSITMVSEHEAASMYGRGVQTRLYADSGVELIMAVVGDIADDADHNFYHNPDLFQSVLVTESENGRARGRFSVVAAVESDGSAGSIRFGLIDESSKLNLNILLQNEQPDDPLSQEETRERLLYLPNMTEELADAILDWLDEDTEPREYGAEDEFYMSLDNPYAAKNGKLESLDELLLVSGMSPELLYGEDTNRNGLLDPNENDGDKSLPFDNSDGVLELGLSAYFSVYGREKNLRSDGTERINANDNALDQLFDALEEEFDEDIARFIVAYRIYGAYQDPSEVTPDDTVASTSGSSTSSSSNTQAGATELQDLAQSTANALFRAAERGTVTRGGLDLSQGGQYQLGSLYDLVGVKVQAQIADEQVMIESPWSIDRGDLQENLPILLDTLSITDDPIITGRININQARLEILEGIPNMPVEAAQEIVERQMIDAGGEPLVDEISIRNTCGWLLIDGLVDINQMRQLDRHLTAGGHVYRAQVVGYFDQGGPYTRLEAVIDATETIPKTVFVRDLTELGKGYLQRVLETGTIGQ